MKIPRVYLCSKFRVDMSHIVLAPVAGVEIVASWNVRHIVR